MLEPLLEPLVPLLLPVLPVLPLELPVEPELLVSELPEELELLGLLLMLDESEPLLPELEGDVVVVVVVVVLAAPLEGELAPEDEAALLLDGSLVVVVVVVDCANVAVAVPNSEIKTASGNFFMIAPYLNGIGWSPVINLNIQACWEPEQRMRTRPSRR